MILLWLACAAQPGGADPVAASLQPWPEDPVALAEACEAQPFAELAITCRVQEAALRARRGEEDEAARACARIPEGTWREECHFRLGEELATTGRAVPAAAWCAKAGWFARRCLTHAAWRMKTAVAPSADLLAEGDELLQAVEASLAAHPDPGVAGEGRDAFRAAWGRSVFLGSGRADPGLARVEGELGPALRTGWATEAVRVLGQQTLPPEAGGLLSLAWTEGRILEGAPDPAPPPERYPPFRPGPEDEGLPHLPLYGGGLRLVGETVDEDATIAILHALYGHPAVGAEAFAGGLDDPRPRIRWTAAKLYALTAEAAELATRATASDDPVVTRILTETPR